MCQIRCALIVALIACVAVGCRREDRVGVLVTGSTQHTVPGDPTLIQAAFAEEDDRTRYVVLAYGRKQDIPAERSYIVVDGRQIAMTSTGKVYVLDPQLNLHETSVTPAELEKPFWEGGGDGFFETAAWQEELYPLLQAHPWPTPGNADEPDAAE